MTSAILGNGSLLAAVSSHGLIERLWWPHVDRGQHLGTLRFAAGGCSLDDAPCEQSYLDGTAVLRTASRSHELVDVVLPDRAVLLRQISGDGDVLVVECAPELDEHTRALAAEVDEATGALVFYRGRTALALAATPAADATFEGVGRVRGSLTVALDGPVVVACAFASTRAAAAALAADALATSFEQHVEARRRADAARLDIAREPETAGTLYRRSLLVFDKLADAATGAVIAAPECDPDFERSGGYGFVWPRDLSFLTLACLAARRDDLARRALSWLARAQDDSGRWLQRYWTDGTLAPAWCEQTDETGSVLFAYEAAWQELRDEALDAELWPSARRAAHFLVDELGDDGLPRATGDLWEEREGVHAYTAAAVAAGLEAAAAFARRHDPSSEEAYAAAAETVRAGLERSFWSDHHGHYLRTSDDPTVDVSLLGLAWPFRAVDPDGPRMRATADAVAARLGRRGGGIGRYESDRYAGGNPWVLAALWLGLYRRLAGDRAGHRRALEYAQRVATPLGLLPEQVTDDGEPAWVVPLGWSHALLVLAARPELAAIVAPRRSPGSSVRVPT